MKEGCEICAEIEKNDVVYEDDKVVAMLDPNPVTTGHLIVTTKDHFPIMEQVPDYLIDHLFRIVNTVSISLFELLKVQGTNMIVNNGIAAGQEHAHFMVNIIPRSENDKIDFQWQPKQLNEEEMSTVELALKEETKTIGAFEKEEEKPIQLEESEKLHVDEDSYLMKQLRRIP